MSNPKMALDLMTRCISADIIERIDFKSLKLVDGSFIDGFFHEYRIDIPKSSDLIQKIGHLIPIVEKKNIDIIETVIQYIYETRKDGISTEEIGKEFQQYLSTTNKELVMTIAQRLREEGMQTGMQQGMQQGIEKGI